MVAHLRALPSRWQLAPVNEPARRGLVDALGVSGLTAQILINRGLAEPGPAAAFLNPATPSLLSDPLVLPDMALALGRLARAVRERTAMVVYGDYDADGVTAAAILLRGLRPLGARVEAYLPDRRREGYGLSVPAVTALAARGTRLIVAVDCGVTAVEAAEAARGAGCDLIILDHHEPPPAGRPLPSAAAVVDPKREPGAHPDLCAAGLAFQTTRALYAALGIDGPPQDLLGLAALGTVADAVPLVGDNRVLVALGLAQLPQTTMPGLVALIETAALRAPLRVRDLSHGLAPRLNAAGRLAHAEEALGLLVTDDPDQARRLATRLEALNVERRALSDAVLGEAVAQIDREGLHRDPAIVLAHEGWHPGVIGIVASRLVERYYRPTVLISLEAGVGRGSGRSIPPLHLVDALGEAAGQVSAFGGHAMAAGLFLPEEAVPAFREAFLQAVARRLGPAELQPVVTIDAEIPLEAVTPALVSEVERLAPFGVGNPEPVFLTRDLRAVATRLVGDGAHLRLVVTDGARTADAIAFQHGGQAELLAFTQAPVDLVYSVTTDHWRDDGGAQMVVDDLQTRGVDLDRVSTDAAHVLDRLFERADDYLGARLGGVEHAAAFHTKVVGVTFEGRQALLPQVRVGESLRLVRDPRNPRDPHAIQVVRQDGGQLGFLRAPLAARLAPSIDAGARYTATAAALTGGGAHAWGLNIYVEREAPWGRQQDVAEGDRGMSVVFADRFAAGLGRGRRPSRVQREVVAQLAAGHPVVARFGPGRGLLPAVLSAAAMLTGRPGPVLVVLPRSQDVDAWGDLARSWLEEGGIRVRVAHGVMPPAAALRTTSALARGDLDLLFASFAWTLRHDPRAASVVCALDGLATPHEVETICDRYGDAVRLITGPLAPQVTRVAAARLAVDGVEGDSAVRDNLRVVDHRDRAGEALSVDRRGSRPDKTLVLASDPQACVAVARVLRARHEDLADRISYYHAGLPAALRRVLENLFAAGRLSTLVAGSHLVEPAAPPDVRRVVAMGLRSSRFLTAEALAVAGLGGRSGVIELRYGPEVLEAAQARLDVRFPTRDLLARCYRALKAFSGGEPWTWSREEAAERPDLHLPEGALGPALEILVEAGVIARDDLDASSARYTLAEPADRVDLGASLRYREGERERAAWADLVEWISGPSARILADLATG